MMNNTLQRSLLFKAALVNLLLILSNNNNLLQCWTDAQQQSSTPNPVCFVCFDNGASTVTLPDALIQLPGEAAALTGGVSEATCFQIQLVAEQLLLVSAEQCPLLDRNDLKLACGCANAVPTVAPAVLGGDGATEPSVPAPVAAAPVPTPVAVPDDPVPEPAPVAPPPPEPAPVAAPAADPPTATADDADPPTAVAPTADPPTAADVAPTADPPTAAADPPTAAAAPTADPPTAAAAPTAEAPVAASSGTESPVASVTSPVASPPTQSGEYDPCYICFDGGASTITNPDVAVPLPEAVISAIGYDSATCEDIRRLGEDERRIPEFACPLVDQEELRTACGCTPIIITNDDGDDGSSPSRAPVSRMPTDPTCPFQEQKDLCPLNMLKLAQSSDDQQCECYNFCNGQFVGCCSGQAGDVCDVNCILERGDSEGRVTGCRNSDRPLAGTDFDDLAGSSVAARGVVVSWLLLTLSFGTICTNFC